MVVIWVMFTFLYIVIPNARVRFGSALMAGIVAGTIFLLFQWGYVYVQRWMTSYNAIYGSFAALPLLLIWMQTSWEILLFGGELSFAYQNIARFGEERESLLISYDQRRKVLLAVMLTVVRNFRDRGGALPADEIRERLDLPTRIVNDVLFQLVQAGQLIAVRSGDGERETAFTPAHDIASMTVYGVLEAVERSGQTTFDLGQTPELARIDRELETECTDIIEQIKILSEAGIPIFAICLGHQLMALAHGAKTYKMKYGHRGANHPVKNLETGKVYISSQNHGYVVDADSIDASVAKPWFVNVNDKTVEGLTYMGKKVKTVQFHPEANAGPKDSELLFDEFMNMIGGNK